MIDRKIALTDRFYDVAAMSPDRALVIGYGGKILETLDGGASWTRIPSGTDDRGLFRITFGDANHGSVLLDRNIAELDILDYVTVEINAIFLLLQ